MNSAIKFVCVFFILLLPLAGFAQKLKKRKVSTSLTESYNVSGDDKKTKQGPYVVMNEKDVVLVQGQYKDGVKDGTWTYFNENGQIVQKYDFSYARLLYDARDTTSIVRTGFELRQKAAEGDTIQVPYKIGGSNYGFYLLYDRQDLPEEVTKQVKGMVMTYAFTISEDGKLEDWTINYTGPYYNKTIKQSIKNLPDDAYEFSAAKLNGQPVGSKVYYAVSLDVNVHVVRRFNDVVTY